MPTAAIVAFATAMFTILNPVGNIAIFADLVADRSAPQRKRTAIKAAVAVAVILVGTVWVGEFTLRLFGITVSTLQVAGGVMIALIALSMLRSKKSTIHGTGEGADAPAPDDDIAIVPLAMPIIAGPGAIVTVIVNTHQHTGLSANLTMSAVCIALAVLIGAGFLAAGPVVRVIGATGMDIITKLMGMVLLAIAVGMLTEGLRSLLPGLAH